MTISDRDGERTTATTQETSSPRSNATTRIGLDGPALHDAVEEGNIPTLLMVLVHLTGDDAWLDPPYQPKRTTGMDDNDSGGLSTKIQREIRDSVVTAVEDVNAGRIAPLDRPNDELYLRMMRVCVAEHVPEAAVDMMAEEMVFKPRVANVGPQAPPAGRVIVIGAGIAGLCAGIHLRDAGIPVAILEKNNDLGGTWLENRYPGARVDTPSHFYSYSFADYDWPTYFAKREDVHRYLHDVADRFGVWADIRLNTEVRSVVYDHDTRTWTLEVETPQGDRQTIEAEFVISAVGQLNRPNVPDGLDIERFTGPAFHTAQWPETIDLQDQRVGVIGTGASAMQVVPAIADTASELTVFQRSPQWMIANENYRRPVSGRVQLLMQHLPYYRQWYRFRLIWVYGDKVHASLQVDPTWPHHDRAINATNDAHREHFTRYILGEIEGHPDLKDKVLPDYPPFGKRMLLDNGWLNAMTREHVTLIDDEVAEVTHDGVQTSDGSAHPLDVLVLATGFESLRLLAPMQIRGRSGHSLREVWGDDDASAYLDITVPDFPNLFCLYGPSTNLAHGGSLIFMIECQVRYIVTLLNLMAQSGSRAIECRQHIHDEYNRSVDEAHERMVWSHGGMDNWYRNERGRVVTNSPWSMMDYWAMTRRANLDDYHTYR